MINNKRTKVHKQSKYFTIMLIPHSSGKTRSLRIPLVAFYMVLAILCFSLVCFTSFIAATRYFRSSAEAAYGELEKSTEANSILQQEKSRLAELLDAAKRAAANASQQQRESYEEQIKYYEEKALELEEKIKELDRAREEIYNKLSQKSYLPEIKNVSVSDTSTKSVFLNVDGRQAFEPDISTKFELLNKAVDEQLVYFDYLIGEMETIELYLTNYPTIWPVWGTVTSEHSYRNNPFGGRNVEYHEGIDIAASTGTKVRATGGGRVIYSGWYSNYGYMVEISHGLGLVTRYAHNSKLLVNVGDYVSRGDAIAQVGSTGRSTGPHVHYEVFLNGVSVNPRQYFE